MRFDVISHPVFSCDEAKAFEAKLFGDDEEKAWRAMVAAGTAVGESILLDWRELTAWPTQARLLVLVGKGHNGGDALLAAKKILETKTDATAEVCLLFSETELRPLTTRAWRELTHAASNRVSRVAWRDLPQRCYRICVDGVFG